MLCCAVLCCAVLCTVLCAVLWCAVMCCIGDFVKHHAMLLHCSEELHGLLGLLAHLAKWALWAIVAHTHHAPHPVTINSHNTRTCPYIRGACQKLNCGPLELKGRMRKTCSFLLFVFIFCRQLSLVTNNMLRDASAFCGRPHQYGSPHSCFSQLTGSL